ncbi:hypothetical protein K5X77_07000 [Vagococcus lutrae]|uniref:hypothetical protein n=1 Tax=Vagococcus lutrae TaxID=81947 RepID=UPI001C985294|nr:hypothetical protein [Vagococcus lutrae]QZN88214.1 hypothetical protein K5X77_07000 [Vagococcus lutrae]
MTNFDTLTQISPYSEALNVVLKLSRLFSDTTAAPFLHYRVSENLFCDFVPRTVNLSREDIAIDAKTIYEDEQKVTHIVGVGNKTFLHGSGNTLQKVAEFNRDRSLYDHLAPKEKIKKIAELRNTRLQFCIDTHDLTDLVYHCVTRDNQGVVRLYNTPMDMIDIENIRALKISDSSISFEDGLNDYSFNLSKSTLFKRFKFNEVQPVKVFEVEIDENPLETLANAFNIGISAESLAIKTTSVVEEDYIILPLYSFSASKGKYVPEKSALNIWNAAGRTRDPNEAYIGVSQKIHAFINSKYEKETLKFFPSRDISFKLRLPNGKFLNAKLCQSNSKALMTNPNKDLGKWLLRKVLKLEEGEVLTYTKLLELGIDSVKIAQLDVTGEELIYSIDFCPIGTYDEFVLKNDI